MKSTTLLALAAAGILSAGCADTLSPIAGVAGSPAGTPRTGALGDAIVRNASLQNAYGNVEERLRDLSVAFRAAVPDTVTFPFDSARLTPEARRILDQQAMWLEANESVRMAVVGHTDLVGAESYNDRLGLRRAQAAVRYLIGQGIDRARLEAVESRGESMPVVATEEREQRNRRAVTVVAGFDRIYVGPNLDGEFAARVYDIWQAGGATAEATEAEAVE